MIWNTYFSIVSRNFPHFQNNPWDGQYEASYEKPVPSVAVTCFETWYYFFSLTNHCNRLFHLILDWRVSTCFITNLAGYLMDNFLYFRNGTLWKSFGAFSFEKFENILTVWNFDGFMSSWQNSPWGRLQVANGSEGQIIDRTRLK